MRVALAPGPFDPLAELAAHGARRRPGEHGALAVFIGSLRDFNQGARVRAMTLEHYPGMTERQLERIAAETLTDHEVLDVLIVHRVGRIEPGEPIVLTAAWAAHRAAAFAACRALIERLKREAPFWKQETLFGGERRWVDNPEATNATTGTAPHRRDAD